MLDQSVLDLLEERSRSLNMKESSVISIGM